MEENKIILFSPIDHINIILQINNVRSRDLNGL
jgi:hypothetical protein